ncbi:outer membrane beta-barrel domain-containing protein [Bdellovibrionota bacterium FG-2]
MFLLFALLFSILQAPLCHAEAEPQAVNVDRIRKKYWTSGNSTEMNVVQDRLYSKEQKIEIGGFASAVASDPFLSMGTVGGSIGYHFSEYLSAHFLAMRYLVSPSSALITFQETRGATTNTNDPASFFGTEASASILYGKLSLIGKAIIYYDLHLLAGAGSTSTQTGAYFTPLAGIGQQIHLSRFFSLKVDYRLMPFHEQIVEKVIPTKLGQVVGERWNWTNSISVGVAIMFGG